MAEQVARYWNNGRETQFRFSGRDDLLMLPVVFNYGQRWDFMVRLFGVNGSTFERPIVGFINSVLKHTYEVCV